MPFYAMNGVSTPIMWAKGWVNLDVITQLGTLLCLVAGLFLVAHFPMAAAAWVVTAVYAGRAVAAVSITGRLLDNCVDLRQWAGRWVGVGAVTVLLQYAVLEGGRHFGLPAVIILLLAFIAMVVLMLVQLRVLAKFGNPLEQEICRGALVKLALLRSRFGKRGST